MTEDERAVLLVGQIPVTIEGQPREGAERRLPPLPLVDPGQIYATPGWRQEPTSELDPRKGR